MKATPASVTCPLCGVRYDEVEGRVCTNSCPLAGNCQLLCCPHCGYETPAPTRLTRWLSQWLEARRA